MKLGAAVLSSLLAVSAAVLKDSSSAGCGKSTKLPLGTPTPLKIHLKDGTVRTYVLTLPAHYESSQKYPLTVGFHAYGSSGAEMMAFDGSAERAFEDKQISLHPDASDDVPDGQPVKRAWNAMGASVASGAAESTCLPAGLDLPWVTTIEKVCYTSCGKSCTTCSWSSCADDVSFVEQLLDKVEEDFCVDTSQVRAHGFSNGGMMVFQVLQSRLAPRFEAMVSVAGLPQNGTMQQPQGNTRFLGIWSGEDYIIPPLGKKNPNGYWGQTTLSNQGLYFTSSNQVVKELSSSFGCASAVVPMISTLSTFECLAVPSCKSAEILSCFHAAGHLWIPDTTSMINSFYDQGAIWPSQESSEQNAVQDTEAAASKPEQHSSSESEDVSEQESSRIADAMQAREKSIQVRNVSLSNAVTDPWAAGSQPNRMIRLVHSADLEAAPTKDLAPGHQSTGLRGSSQQVVLSRAAQESIRNT